MVLVDSSVKRAVRLNRCVSDGGCASNTGEFCYSVTLSTDNEAMTEVHPDLVCRMLRSSSTNTLYQDTLQVVAAAVELQYCDWETHTTCGLGKAVVHNMSTQVSPPNAPLLSTAHY